MIVKSRFKPQPKILFDTTEYNKEPIPPETHHIHSYETIQSVDCIQFDCYRPGVDITYDIATDTEYEQPDENATILYDSAKASSSDEYLMTDICEDEIITYDNATNDTLTLDTAPNLDQNYAVSKSANNRYA